MNRGVRKLAVILPTALLAVALCACASTRFVGLSVQQARAKAQQAVAAHFGSGPPPFRLDHATRGTDQRNRPAWTVYFKRTAGTGPGCTVYVRFDEAHTTPFCQA